jgi:rhamnopyranosyl-N-acetylglucosaminyl-diphospho-decaprenol beta-1,3/1,4-galactofuranosyltransferase
MATPGRIAAVVVTRDRPALLEQALAALRAQTRPPQRVIVVDNASGVPTVELLSRLARRDDRLEVLRSERNLGGAGGFALGLQHACAAGYDWVWLQDDDAVARPDALCALERTLPSLGADVGAVCGTVVEFGAPALQHRRRFGTWTGLERALPAAAYGAGRPPVRIDTASFVGLLVAAGAVARAGLPRADLFLAYDDTDYSLRLRRAGRSLWLVPASVVDHLRQPQGRLRAGVFERRHYFNVRNRIVVAREHARVPVLPALAACGVGLGLLLVCGGWRSAAGWRWLGRALRDGYLRRLGAGPAV